MKISVKGIALIREFEGCELRSYFCSGNVLTIGIGHTGPDVKPGMTITVAEAERLLRQDLARFERGVEKLVKVPITQSQFDSLVSICFNIGLGAFQGSTLLRLLNEGKHAEAGDQFLRWDKADGRQLAGLTRRRQAERRLYYSEKFLG